MLPTDVVLALTVIGVAIAVSPAEPLHVVLLRSISQSRHSNAASAIGSVLGTVVPAVACALGLAAALERFPQTLTVLQVGGGLYFLHVGLNKIADAQDGQRSLSIVKSPPASKNAQPPSVPAPQPRRLLPKTIALTAAFVPQLLQPSSLFISPWQLVGLGALVAIVVYPAKSSGSMLGNAKAAKCCHRTSQPSKITVTRNWLGGAALLGVAGRTFLFTAKII